MCKKRKRERKRQRKGKVPPKCKHHGMAKSAQNKTDKQSTNTKQNQKMTTRKAEAMAEQVPQWELITNQQSKCVRREIERERGKEKEKYYHSASAMGWQRAQRRKHANKAQTQNETKK